MIVEFVWPGCDYYNKRWGNDPIDAFFVGFTLEEAAKFFPAETYTEADCSPTEIAGKKLDKIGGRVWFLIGVQKKFAQRFPWYYPISNQWNGYSPFKPYNAEINSLEEIDTLDIHKYEKKHEEETENV